MKLQENTNNDFIKHFFSSESEFHMHSRVPWFVRVHSSASKQGAATLNYSWTTDVTWTILMMSLLPFWALNVKVALLLMEGLLSMDGQKALRFVLVNTGLKRHAGEQLMTEFSFLGELSL